MKTSIACRIGPVEIGTGTLAIIAGPCMAESLDLCLRVGEHLADVCRRLGLGYVFKASYDKANRTSGGKPRGPGIEQGLAWLAAVREKLGVPVLSDVHDPAQAARAGKIIDCLQIPAFLCRQTDLLLAAGRTGRMVNIKKGQFVAPHDIHRAAEKVVSTGNRQVILTERGSSFGYNNLVVDMRGLKIMRDAGWPVVFDATHSVQVPGGAGDASGGQPQFIETLARAAVAAGVDGVFVEVHDEPEKALSDGPNAVRLSLLRDFWRRLTAIDSLVESANFLHTAEA
jgi:2-dehydro-3-deoxyphosphooctonate aldolase (KDO 8-P synthase)